MAIVCTIDLNMAEMYSGKSLMAKVNGKKHKVYLQLLCNSNTLEKGIEFARKSNNILFIEYQGFVKDEALTQFGASSNIQINYNFEVGNNFSEQDILHLLEDIPDNITPVVRLQPDFADLKFISELCAKYPRLRFIGGNLFRLEGLNLGSYDKSLLDKKGIKYSIESYLTSEYEDILQSADITELNVTVSDKPEKESKQSSSSSKPKAKKPVSSRFAGMFTGGGVDF